MNPFLGVDGGGNTVPGASVPFGFASVSPDTTGANSSGYDSAGLILGFSQTHVSGTGGGSKYGNFRVTPTAGQLTVNNLAFHKTDESAAPGFYQVVLNPSTAPVHVQITASRLAGFEQFTYPPSMQQNIILDATAAIPTGVSANGQRATHAVVDIIDNRHISGSASFIGGWSPAPYTLYFFAVFSRPMRKFGTWSATLAGSTLHPGSRHFAGGDQRQNYQNRMGMYASFDTKQSQIVMMKLAVSFISVQKARQNLEAELPDWNFEAARQRASDAWRQILSKILVEGGTDAERRIFYSSLYRSHVMPHDLTGENAWWKSKEPHYEDFYTLWDTFRTLHPLLTLIEPDRQRDIVRSLIDTYVHTGWLPDARVAGSNGLVQGGSSGDIVVADALVKGLKGIDYQAAYAALKKDADQESPDPLDVGRELTDYLHLGYMSLNQTRSASRTVEYSYDDFAVAEVAQLLGHHQEALQYLKRSGNWKNLWNDKLRCIQPRYADGRWLENFDCDREYPDETTAWWDAPYYEGSARQYSTFVPQDIAGLIDKCGGDKAFVAWLDVLFDKQLYTQGNEPDILAPYLYIYAGRQDRTAERIRNILRKDYKDDRSGLPGNDDAGTMSSWYVWSAIGLFPNAGQPFYYIGSPVFRRSTIQLSGGKTFIISAPQNSAVNTYVQRAELNGRPLDRAWLTHDEIVSGGRLTLYMGSRPTSWARKAPPPPTIFQAKATKKLK